MKKHISIVIAYTMIIPIFGIIIVQAFLYLIMQPVFPNLPFILTLFVMIAFSWMMGLSVKRYISKAADSDGKVEGHLKMLFICGTVIASICFIGGLWIVL